MLPAFVIGLREGLETVVVVGAIVVFLTHQGRHHQLRVVWISSALAAVLCVAVAVVLRLVESGLSVTGEDRFEAVVGAAAVLTVTAMVVWMRRLPGDLLRDPGSAAARRLTRGSVQALAAMSFLVVAREGFEISVFVLALVGTKGGSPLLGGVGAAAGVLVALAVGVAVVRGGTRLDVARFFRVTAAVLVVSAAGLAMTTIHSANAGGWVVFGQTPQFDWSRLAPPGTVQASVVTGMFGIQPYPTLIDVVVWLAYLVPMLLVVVVRRGLASALWRRMRPRTRRLAVVSGLCTLAVVVSSGPLLRSALGEASAQAGATAGPARMPLPAQGLAAGSYLLFRDTTVGGDYGRLGLVASDDPTGPRALTSLMCDRVDFEGGAGLCLERPVSGLVITTTATVFDSRFRVLRQVTVPGLPSRARVSPDGRYGAVTTFVTGDSYAAVNTYSTRTDIIDMRTGTILFDLSQLAVTRDGRPFEASDFNFWGVTFTGDGRQFYATLGTGGTTYLIRGVIATRRATVIATNVECPSLSPDGTEIAFKRRLPGSVVRWRLSVLDLATGQVHPLAETRSVDDQVEWLDNTTVLYGVVQDRTIAAMNPLSVTTPSLTNGASLATDTWSVPADGGGTPRLFSSDTWSEVVTTR